MRLLLAQGDCSGTMESLAPSDPPKYGTAGAHLRHTVS